MKKHLKSKIAITGLAAFAFTAMSSNHATAADLTWNWSATPQIWDLNHTAAWAGGATFEDGKSVEFLAGGGYSGKVSIWDSVAVSTIDITSSNVDAYTFVGDSITLSDTNPINATLTVDGSLTLNTRLIGADSTTTITKSGTGTLNLNAESVFGASVLDIQGGTVTAENRALYGAVGLKMAASTTLQLGGGYHRVSFYAKDAVAPAGGVTIKPKANENAILRLYNAVGNSDGNINDIGLVNFQDNGTGKLTLILEGDFTTSNNRQFRFDSTKANTYSGGTYLIGNADLRAAGGVSGSTVQAANGFGTGPLYLENVRTYITYSTGPLQINNDIYIQSQIYPQSRPGFYIRGQDSVVSNYGAHLTLTGKFVIERYNTFFIDNDKGNLAVIAFKPSSGTLTLPQAVARAKDAYRTQGWLELNNSQSTILVVSASILDANGNVNTGGGVNVPATIFTNAYPNIQVSSNNGRLQLRQPTGQTPTDTQFASNIRLFGTLNVTLDQPNDGNSYQMVEYLGVIDGIGILNHNSGDSSNFDKYMRLGGDGYGVEGIYQTGNILIRTRRSHSVRFGNGNMMGNTNFTIGLWDDATRFESLSNNNSGPRVYLNWSGDMLLNMNIVKIERDETFNIITKSEGTGTLTVARPIMLNSVGRNAIMIGSGGMIFGYGKKYASPFDYTSLYTKKEDGSMDVNTMNLAGALKIATGSTLVLDYISRASDNDIAVVNKVLGLGDFIVGGYRLDARQGNLVAHYTTGNSTVMRPVLEEPDFQDFKGRTFVNANTMLTVGGDQFKSTDITIAESGSMDSGYGIDLTHFNNRGSYTGDISFAAAGVLSNTGSIGGSVDAALGVSLNGIGRITGNASFVGAVGHVNSGLGGAASIGGNLTLDATSQLTFRAGESIAVTGTSTLGGATINLVAGKDGFSGAYNLITGGSASGNFVLGANYRAGVLSVTGATVTVGSITDTTLASATAWDFSFFKNSDNVTFNGTGGAVVVDAAGVYANKINIDVDAYSFTGGSIAGALYVKDNNTVSFNNKSADFGYINLGADSVATLNLLNDIVLKSGIEGSGTLEIAGTKKVQWNVTDNNFTGSIKVSGGVLDLINTTGATIELAGGTLTSTSKARVGSVITFAENTSSIIDLGGAAYQTDTYAKWTNSIIGADGAGVKLTLMNGALDNTAGKKIGTGSNAEAASQTFGEVLKINDLTLADAWINRPISPADTGGKISVISSKTVANAANTDHVSHSVLDTYATIDLSNNGALEVSVAKYSELIAFNFLIGDGTLTKTGSGLMKFFRIDSEYHESGDHASMNFDGSIEVNGGTLEFIRNMGKEAVDGVSGAPFTGNVDNPTSAKIIVNNSGILYANGAYSLGSEIGGIPEVVVNTGGKILLNGENMLIEKLTLSGAYVAAMIEAFDSKYYNSLGAVKDGVSSLLVTGSAISEIATQKFSATQGDWNISVDTGATLLITAKLEASSGKTFTFGGGGTSIIAEGVTNNLAGSTVKIDAGATVQIGYSTEADGITDKPRARGDLGTATVIADGTLNYYRNGDYDFLAMLEGSGTWNKYRDWTMTIKTANNFAGVLSVNAGTVALSGSEYGSLNADVVVKNKAYFDVSSYASGYTIQGSNGTNSDSSTWDKSSQSLVLESGSTLKGTIIAGTGGVVFSDGGYVNSLVVNSGGSMGGLGFNSKTESAKIDLAGGTWTVGNMVNPVSGGAITPGFETTEVKGHISISGGSSLAFDIDSLASSADKVNYTGRLTLNATDTNQINLLLNDTAATYVDEKSYTLFTGQNVYTATDLAKWFKSGRASLDFTASTATSIIVKVTGAGPETITWNGANNAVWKNSDDASKIWKLSGNDTFFINNDTVVFDATAAGNVVRVDSAGVVAKAMTVTGKDYQFTGDGSITVSTALTIDGAKASFSSAKKHNLTSVVLQNDGTLNLGVAENDTLTIAYGVNGAGNLEKSGAGILDLTGSTTNTYTGKTIISGGTVKIDALSSISATGGDIVLNGGKLEVLTNDINFGTRLLTTGTTGGSIVSDKNLTVTLGTLGGKLTKSGTGDLTIQDNYVANNEISIADGKLLAKTASFAALSGSGILDASNTALKVQGGTFDGSIANITSLEVGTVNTSLTNNTFTYQNAAGVTVSTKVGNSSSLVVNNITLGAGLNLEAGYDAAETDVAKKKGNITGNVVLNGANLNIADSNPTGNGTIGILNVDGNVTLNAAKWNVSVDIAGKKTDKLIITGTLTLNGVSDLNLKQDGGWNQNDSYVIAEYAALAGATTPTDIKNALVVKGLTRKEITYSNSGTQLSFKITSQSATWLWDNAAGTMEWNCYQDATNHGDANWNDQGQAYDPPYFVAGENVVFRNNAAGSIKVDGDKALAGDQGVSANKMTFENTTGSDYAFTGGAITANQVYINGTGTVTFNNAGNIIVEKLYLDNGKVVLGVDNALSGSIKFDGAVGATLELAASTQNTLDQLEGVGKGIVDLKSAAVLNLKTGQLTGGTQIKGGSDTVLNKTGSATDELVLSGINTTDFTGTLNAQSGILTLNGNNAVANFNGASGAKVKVNGNFSVGNGSNAADISGSGTLTTKGTFDLGGNNAAFTGNLVIDTGSTTKLLSGTAISGTTLVDLKGTLDLNGNNASAVTVNTASGSALQLKNAAEFTFTGGTLAGNITDNGKLIKNGTGTAVLGGNNNYGTLVLNGGTVEAGSGANLGAASVEINNGSVLSITGNTNATGTSVTINNTNGSISVLSGKTANLGDFSGNGILKKSGDGVLVLDGNNSGFSGALNLEAGTLNTTNAITVTGVSGSGNWNIGSGATLDSSSDSVYSGMLGGSGSFTKKGSGSLTFNQGNDAYTGSMNANGGKLIANGSFKGSDLSVSNGSFGGTSTFKSADFGADSVFLSNLTGGGVNLVSNILSVDNLLNISALKVDVIGSVSSATADNYKLLLMDSGSLTIDWNNVSIGNVFTNNYSFQLINEGNKLYLAMEVLRPDYDRFAQGSNQLTVANYLDNAWYSSDNFWKNTVANEALGLADTNPGAVSKFLGQLAGVSFAHATQSRELATEHFRQLWSQRLTTGKASQFSLEHKMSNVNDGGDPVTKFEEIKSTQKESYWAQPFTYYADMKNEAYVNGYEYTGYGITGGMDSRFDTGYVGGLAFFYEDATVDENKNSNKTQIDDTRFALFAGWEGEDVTVIASGNYGVQRYDGKRDVNLGDLGGRNTAKYKGNTYGASIDFTAKMTTQFRFIAGFDWENISRDSFTERDADFAMSVKKESYDTYSSRLGIRFDQDFDTVGFYGLLAWKHRFDDNESEVTGYYSGMNGEFTANGLSNNPDSILCGVGTEYNFTPEVSVFADVNLDINADRTDVGGNVGLRYIW